MAQNIILKRSSLSGKVPTTSSLDLGEIALNTYDGRAFIHKSGSEESIEQIVVTNSITTGSINITYTGSFGEIDVTNDLNVGDSIYVTNDIVGGGDVDVVGAVTASFFVGDGSQLTGIDTSTDTEIPANEWDYNLPDSGSLSDGNNTSIKYTIDFQAEGYDVRPVGYQTFITNNNGSTEIIPGTEGILFIVNNQEVGRIGVEGIVATPSPGTVSGSSQISALGYATTGSNTFNGNINITGSLTASGLIYPTTDGTEFSYLQTDGTGNLSFADVATTYDTIHNGEGSSLLAGTPLYVSGSNGANPIVYRADASNPLKMPVTYVAAEEITTNGRGILLGEIEGVNTTGYSAGTTIYVAEGGGWSSNRPSGSSSIVQVLGVVTKEGNGGKGLVLNPGPATLPNLQTGNIWVGNSTNQPVLLSTASLATTGSNTYTGLQTFKQIQEVISLKPSIGLGTHNFDFNSGSIFYVGGLTGSGTWNVQNIPSSSNTATSLTFVVEQGATAYTASAYQLGGTALSVKWLDGTVPTGSANSTDVIGLTAFRSGSSWNAIGSLSKFS